MPIGDTVDNLGGRDAVHHAGHADSAAVGLDYFMSNHLIWRVSPALNQNIRL
jgi:hypothetical protein